MADRERKKQASRLPLLALMVVMMALAACGKKPGSIDPPPSVEDDHFPLTYPDPATDPKPKG